MMHARARSGYILILTMLLLSAAIMLVSHVINRSLAYLRLSRLVSDRESAKMLALSGVQIALSQLSFTPPSQEQSIVKGSSGEQNDREVTAQSQIGAAPLEKSSLQGAKEKWLVSVLSSLNQWQTFAFKEDVDGIEGSCVFQISCEQGKVNINALYDFKEKKFVKKGSIDASAIFKALSDGLKSLMTEQGIEVFERCFKENGHNFLEDVSALLMCKEFQNSAELLFPEKDRESNKIALTDIFTVSTIDTSLQPLLLSNGMRAVLGLTLKPDVEQRRKKLEEIAKILLSSSSSAEQQWHMVEEPLSNKKYEALPSSIRALFTAKYGLTTFCVVSYGSVGLATQKVAAILEKSREGSKKQSERYIVTKLYWL
jgi:hypothetical protein